MNLRNKLTLGFFSMALVVGLVSLLTILSGLALQEDIDELINVNVEETTAAADVAAVGEKGEKWAGDNSKEGGPWLSEAEELEEVEELLAELGIYTAAAHDLLMRYSDTPSKAEDHFAFFKSTVEPLARDIKEEVDELRLEAVTEARGEGAHFKADLRTTQVGSVVVTLLAIFMAALLGTHFARRISQPVDQLKSAIGEVSRGRFDIMLQDGSRDEIGELAVAFGNMADRLRETTVSRKYVEGIVASMSNTLIVMSPDGQIERLNRAAIDLLGYDEEELAGVPIGLIFVEDELLLKGTEIADLVETGVIQNSEKTLLSKTGRHIPVYLSAAVMRDDKGGLGGIVFVATDISEQRRVAQMKADFISTVSHELRTPLTSIKGSLGLVANGALGQLPERAHDMIILANKNTDRLMTLVNDILDMEKLETGRMEFDLKPLDLSELVATTVESNQGYAMEHGVVFSVSAMPDGPTVRGDADRLTQVIVNLISNAAKFSPAGENIEIAVARDNGTARVSVSDHGPGIPSEYGDQIFEPFSQVDTSDHREKTGSGLGLSISKSIIEKHVGAIGFHSEVGVGSTFFFTLPVHSGS